MTSDVLARRDDPQTSKDAAADAERERNPGQRVYMLRGFATRPSGLTDEEAMLASAQVDPRSGYWKRASDLRNAGLIEVVRESTGQAKVRLGSKGAMCEVSRVTSLGWMVLEGRIPMPSPERGSKTRPVIEPTEDERKVFDWAREVLSDWSQDRMVISTKVLTTLVHLVERGL